jgi:hypothetical protein
MNMRKPLYRILSAALALTLIFSSYAVAAAAEVTASDSDGLWSAKIMNEWTQNGWLAGYPDGSVQPNKKISRGEFITFVNRAFGSTEKAEIRFTDLKAGAWQYDQVAIAVKAGYLKGFQDNTIRVAVGITREESAVMLANILKPDKTQADMTPFKDADKLSGWSKEAVASMFSAKVMSGYPDGTFRPRASMTRAEAIVAIDNALKAALSTMIKRVHMVLQIV